MLLSNLLQTTYNMVDMAIVGRFIGSAGLAGVAIGTDIMSLMLFVALGFCSAVQVIISQLVGASDKEAVSRSIGTFFTSLMILAVVLTAVCFIGVDTFLKLMNTPPEAYAYARTFILTYSAGIIFSFGYNLVSAILRGMGDSRHPLMFIAISAFTNLIFALLFVAVLGWGTFGAALATVTGQTLSFITSVILLYRNRSSFGFDFKPKSFLIDPVVLKKFLKLAIPMCLQSVMINFSMLFVNSFINAYGVVATSVTSIGWKIALMSTVISNSLSTAGAAMIGQSLGAGKSERVPRVIRFSMVVNVIYAVIFTTIIYLIPRAIFGLFNSETEVLDMAMLFVPVVILNIYGFAIRAPFMGLINGVGRPILNFCVAILDGVLGRIGLALLMGITLGMGINGFWYGAVFAGYIPIIIGIVYLASGKWKTAKLLLS